MRIVIIVVAIFFIIVSCDSDFPFEHAGLEWSTKTKWMSWQDASEYCDEKGGRLPTISELRTLIRDCLSTKTGGGCGVTDDCLSSEECCSSSCFGCEFNVSDQGKYNVFGAGGESWSSSSDSDNLNFAWLIYFDSANIVSENKERPLYFYCVR